MMVALTTVKLVEQHLRHIQHLHWFMLMTTMIFIVVVSLVGSAADVTSLLPQLKTVLRVINITTQPQNAAVIEGATATFTIAATITSDSITYQWQISTNGGGAWSNINGANGSSYTTPATTYPTTPSEQFRCVLTNPAATTVTSTAATLTVNESEFVSAPFR